MTIKNSVKPSDLINLINNLEKQPREFHCNLYDDGIWKIDFERHPYGTMRFWVSREDSNGNFLQSPFTCYGLNTDGSLRYSVDGIKVKKTIVDKMKSYYIAIEKHINK